MPRCHLSNEATDDIAHIGVQGIINFGPAQAKLYHARLLNSFDLLARHPRMGAERPDLDTHVRIFPFQSHIIVYDIMADDEIVILRVLPAVADWQTILNG